MPLDFDVPELLVEILRERFPDKCPRPGDDLTFEEVCVKAGQQQVIDHLHEMILLREEMTKE